jgi:hypothetical protein
MSNTVNEEFGIPIQSMDEMLQYRQAIMALLHKVEVGDCDPVLKENLKTVYKLLSHLNPDKILPDHNH